jgi:exopolyphosphatase/guanosine-5'-triphosphate,3'-diphosphate pyrophosphatase
MIFAAVDIGANTLRLLVSDVSGQGARPLRYEREITRLGAGVRESGLLGKTPLEKSLSALSGFAEIIRRAGAVRTWCVGTSALREARNARDFIERARLETGLDVEIVDGEREAGLTARGVISAIERPGEFLIMDIGGGSTEFVYSTGGTSGIGHLTVPVGVVKLAEAHMHSDPPSEKELEALREEARGVSDILKGKMGGGSKEGARFVGTAGTATTLAAIDLGLERFDAARVHNRLIPLERLDEMASSLCSMPASKRAGVKGLEPQRADLIIPGIILTISVMRAFSFPEILISSAGLLEGMVEELYERTVRRQ